MAEYEVRVDYLGPDGPVKDRLKERVRDALATAGLPVVLKPSPPRPTFTVIRGGAGQQ